VDAPAGAVGALLRGHRRDAELTQESLAARAGLSWRGPQHLAAVAAAQGRAGRALRLAGAAAALREAAEFRPPPADSAERERWVALARAALDADGAAAAWAEGPAMPLEQVVAYALEDDRGG
jgi:hypothetical protein